MIKSIVCALLNLLNRFVPKSDVIIFNSYPGIGGNTLEVYRYFVCEMPETAAKYRIIWTVNKGDIESAARIIESVKPGQNYEVCRKNSFRGLCFYLRASVIISTHNYITDLHTHGVQKHYNLWHGMPFKTIGLLDEKNGRLERIQCDYTIATSPVFRDIMARSCGISESLVMLTGQPCNDRLFHPDNALDKFGISHPDNVKVIMWMPTYRKSVEGALREDGNSESLGIAAVLSDHFEELDSALKRNGYILLIKPHPMDAVNVMKLPESESIRVIHDTELGNHNVSLYELLGDMDVLLTDYSSVFIDFLCLDKPMAFVFDDLESYGSTRGFNFEQPLRYLPGEKITSFEILIKYLDCMEDINDRWADERRRIAGLFHSYMDDRSSERVCRMIWS